MHEIDLREAEIQRVQKLLDAKSADFTLLQSQFNTSEERCSDLESEMELKSGENNRLRQQKADIEAAMQDLYLSRKGHGSLQIEIDSLRADNERLLRLVRQDEVTVAKNGTKIDNDWIPTEAVRAIMQIQKTFKGQLSETAVSQILYELNTIWRNIMRVEVDAVQKKL